MATEEVPTGADRADLAVVVVHGIGAQDVGDTLLAWAEPILFELRKIVQRSGGTLRYGPAQLAADPAHAKVCFDLGDSRTITWNFIEARWAASFPWPGASDVLRWGGRFTVRVTDRYRRQLERPILAYRCGLNALAATPGLSDRDRMVVTAAKMVALVYALFWTLVCFCGAALAIAVGWTAATTLTLLGAIPFVRGKIAPLTTHLIASIGDAYLFTSRPLHAAAMVESIRADLKIARANAKQVCVVAHSQGAALSIRTLLAEGTDVDADLLITIGAGVTLLGADAAPVERWLRVAPGMRWVNIWTPWDPVPSGPIADCPADELRRYRTAVSLGNVLAPLVRATPTADFLAAECIPHSGSYIPGPEEWPVHCRCSLIRDHTAYAANLAQVIRPVTQRLISLSGGRSVVIPAVDEAHVRRARYLGVARVAAGLCAVGLLFLHLEIGWLFHQPASPGLPEVATQLTGALERLPLVEYFPGLQVIVAMASKVIYESILVAIIFMVLYLPMKLLRTTWNNRGEDLSVTESNESVRPFEWRYFNYRRLNRTYRGRADDGSRWWSSTFFMAALWMVVTMLQMLWFAVVSLAFFEFVDGRPFAGWSALYWTFFAATYAVGALAVFHVIIWPRGGLRLSAVPERGFDFRAPARVSAPLAQLQPQRPAQQWAVKADAVVLAPVALMVLIAAQNLNAGWSISLLPGVGTTFEWPGVLLWFMAIQYLPVPVLERAAAQERFGKPHMRAVALMFAIGMGAVGWIFVAANWRPAAVNVLVWQPTMPLGVILGAAAVIAMLAAAYAWRRGHRAVAPSGTDWIRCRPDGNAALGATPVGRDQFSAGEARLRTRRKVRVGRLGVDEAPVKISERDDEFTPA